MVAALLAGLLLGRDGSIPSSHSGDTTQYFVAARSFAVEHMRQGNLPLWNPHVFSGTPFLGVFQSSPLYPPNAFYLVLPLASAITLEMAVGLLLLGVFTLLWLRHHGLRPLSCFAGATIAMLGAPSFARVLAGQLTVIDTVAWMPLLLLVIDRLAERVSLGWLLAGTAVIAAMMLAGHPPTLLMAAVTAALYAAIHLARPAGTRRLRFLGSLFLLCVGSSCLAAIQVFTGVDVAAETMRGGGMSLDESTTYSLPPEHLMTLVAWDAFGTASHYFGRWWYWDATAYLGVVACCLAFYGAVRGEGRFRRVALVLCVLLGVLALGRYTPVYGVLHALVPGFVFVRAPSKFMFFASLFAAALAAIGVDRLLEMGRAPRTLARFAAVLSVLLLIGLVWNAMLPAHAPASPISLLASLGPAKELPARSLAEWRDALTHALVVPALFAVGVTVVAGLSLASRTRAILLVAAAVLELFVFARAHVGGTGVRYALLPPGLVDAYERAGNSRVLESNRQTNVAVLVDGYGVWGYDPLVLRRYAQFVGRSQELAGEGGASSELRPPVRYHPLLRLLRVEYAAAPRGRVIRYPGALPRLLLVPRYRVVSGPKDALAVLGVDGFDPTRTVILEEEPSPKPDARGHGAGRIEVVDSSTDHVTLEAELPLAAILLMTDAYAHGWRAVALPGSVQRTYEVLPANLALRAIPLAAGRHRLRVEYAPAGYRLGAIVSGVSLACFVVGVGLWGSRRYRDAH